MLFGGCFCKTNKQHDVATRSKGLKYIFFQGLEKTFQGTISKYKETIIGVDNPVCITCLDELQEQQVTDKKAYDQKLIDDEVRRLLRSAFRKSQ